jgi:hypothetical protein
MAFDPVLTGATANDGTGDPLRTAFTRINDNFDLAVEGAASSTDGTVVQFDGTTGKVVKASSVPVADIIVEGDARLTDSRTPTAHGNEAHTSTFVDATGAAAAAPVQSVNTQTGAVVLAAADVGAYPDTNPSSFVDAAGAAAAAPVQSVNTLTGAVVLDAAAVGADPTGTAATAVSTHNSDTTSVHGIANTATLVVGPASATTDSVAVFADTTGKLLKDGTGTVTAGKFSPTATTVAGNGMYLPAANTVAFSTAGAERLRVGSSGNVGIGVTDASTALDIGSGVFTQREGFTRNRIIASGSGMVFSLNDSQVNVTRSFIFQASEAGGSIVERFRILGSGAVIFGNGDSAASPAVATLRGTNASGTNVAGPAMTIQAGRGTGTGAGGSLSFQTAAAGTTGTTLNAATTRLFINAAGNVGIGTTSPARPLHVSDVMRLEPRATAPGSPAKGDIYFDSSDDKLKCYDGTAWQNLF